MVTRSCTRSYLPMSTTKQLESSPYGTGERCLTAPTRAICPERCSFMRHSKARPIDLDWRCAPFQIGASLGILPPKLLLRQLCGTDRKGSSNLQNLHYSSRCLFPHHTKSVTRSRHQNGGVHSLSSPTEPSRLDAR